MITSFDKQILQEIVRVVQSEQRVPKAVRVNGQSYLLTYLDDHDRRMEDALANRDPNLLSMLFGQLASKVKYQLDTQESRPSHGAETSRVESKGKSTVKPSKSASGRGVASARTRRSAETATTSKVVAKKKSKGATSQRVRSAVKKRK